MDNRNQSVQTLAMVVVAALLVLTAWSNATVMFWLSVTAMIGVLIWFSADRKAWMASLTGVFVAVAVVLFLVF